MNSKKPLTTENAMLRAATLCSRAEQAESEIRKKLSNWGLQQNEAENVIERLKKDNYLNASRYAHALTNDRFRFSHWGKVKIAYILRQKGIPQSEIEAALSEIDDEAYRNTLIELLKAKLRITPEKEPMKLRASLVRFASARGFESRLIFPVLSALLKDGCADEYPEDNEDF
ncbi:MAG: RecX family transcriptional regulator [Muribaculaceae bacterium]|jgi:regulatory protein|nr:RecX family transcriptional regulator [Muribaculaceae bacterium]